MSLYLFNTLTRKKELFEPIDKDNVRMYVCGPTLNGVPHLGHARQQITFDILRKYLIFCGYKVTFVSNVTDIEDKIIDKANELGLDIYEFSKKNLINHLEDYLKLGVDKPTIQPKATEYVPQMIDLIKILEKKGFTYVIPNDGVYYDLSKFPEYGKLSHQNQENLLSGVRVNINEDKRNKNDFVLWKFSKPNEPYWDSPWGNGRPGWHIECSAMSASILGLPLDIHGGGQDLIFPHHEDEIAQSEAAFEKKLANYWVHNGMVNVDKVKMSKSLGNFKTIRDLFENYSGEVIRLFIISAKYTSPLDFSKEALDSTKNSYIKLKNIINTMKDDGEINQDYLDKFKSVMDDDLNTPQAISLLWELIKNDNAKGKYKTIEKIDTVFGLNLTKKQKIEIPEKILQLVKKREMARQNKNWNEADIIRDQIMLEGYQISDTLEGQKIFKKL